MLILRRRAGESLLIGDNVEIEILDINGSSVKIGIQAPKTVSILRKELQLTRAQNCAAARDSLLRDEGPDPASVAVLENGVDLERFERVPLFLPGEAGKNAERYPKASWDILDEISGPADTS